MKKILVFFMVLFLVVGCTGNTTSDNSDTTIKTNSTKKSSKKQVSKAVFHCNTDDSVFDLYLENGQIVKYVDSEDGDLGNQPVEILNSEHLVGVSDNDQAFIKMNEALFELEGSCSRD